jgi:flagellar biosynthetic protein FliQ
MNIEQAIEILRSLITTSLLLVAPLLGSVMVVGIVVGLFQSATSIQEQTLTFVPKLLAVAFVIIVMAPWALRILMQFTAGFLSRLPEMVR